MRVLVLQHEWNDGPGYLGEALEKHGALLDVVRLDRDESIPDLTAYDMLLIMGGEMNVYQEDRHPWLARETGSSVRRWKGIKPCWVCAWAVNCWRRRWAPKSI